MKKIITILSVFIFTTNVVKSQIILTNDTTASCNSFTYNLQALSANLSSITSDDTHSAVVPIGFIFNFYGGNYTQLVISGNGYLTFDLAQAGLSSPWIINTAIPNTGSMPENAIMAPWHDINPATGGSITFGTVGTAPNRIFIVTWCEVPMYSCSSLLHTSQIILHEGSNKIEMFLKNKPVCATHNGGNAVQGLVSENSTNFDIVDDPNLAGNPARNFPLQWTASDEGWEFIPNGNTSYTINEITYVPIVAGLVNWYDDAALTNLIGSGPSLPINLTSTGTYIYYAQISGACSPTTLTDNVTINFDAACCDYAGDNNSIDICSTDPPFDLITGLNNNPSSGGTWLDPNGNIFNSSVFNPATDIGGIYTYNITGTTGCPDDNAFLTINSNSIANLLVSPSTACSGDSLVTLTANLAGGEFSGANITSPNTFIPNTIGNNNITYTLLSGCATNVSITVFETPTLLTQNITPNTCPGDSIGTANISVTGGNTPYNYNWYGEDPQALPQGTFNYTVTDANQCAFNGSFTIYAPPTPVLTAYNSSCYGDDNGSIGITLNSPSNSSGTVSVLTYCASSPNTNPVYAASSSIIENVTLSGDNYNINNNTAGIPDSLQDYTLMYADVTEGQSYTIDVTLNGIGNTTSYNYSGAKVYIDYNIDGDFLDVGEEIGIIPYTNATTVGSSVPINFTVPNNGFYGPTRMRVVSQYIAGSNPNSSSITPCAFAGNIQCPTCIPIHGATEDYSIVLTLPTFNASILWDNNSTADSITNLNPDTYTAVITYDSGCVVEDSSIVSEPTAILFNASVTNILCNNTTGQISISPSGGYGAPYTITDWGGITDPSAIGTGIYTITVSDLTSNNLVACESDTTIVITEPSYFNVNFTTSEPDGEICYNDPLSLIFDFDQGGTAPFTIYYTITDNLGNPTAQVAGPFISAINYISVYPLVGNNTYNVDSITDANGCFNQNTIGSQSIYVNSLPDIDITAAPNPICVGDNATLLFSGLSGTPPYTVDYSAGGVVSSANVPNTGLNLLVTPTTTTTYALTYATDANGCESILSNQTILIVNEIPQVMFTTPNTETCDGDIIQLQFDFTSGAAPWNVNYSTDGVPTVASISNTNDSISISPNSQSVYTINSITDNNNCSNNISQTLTINSNPLPIITLSGGGSICGDGNTANIVFTTISGTPPYDLTYSNGVNSDFVSNIGNAYTLSTDQGGIYTIQDLTDSKGCKATSISGSAYININPLPEANITAYPQSTTISDPIINFIDISNGHINGIWNFDDGNTTSTNFDKLTHVYGDTGTYQVSLIIESDSGCTDIAWQTIIISPDFTIYLPNAFTPNNDLYNDYFLPIVDGVSEYEFSVYDRLGNRIFRTNDYSNDYLSCINNNLCSAAWDGKINNGTEYATKGVYIYALVITDINGKLRTYEGAVTLIR